MTNKLYEALIKAQTEIDPPKKDRKIDLPGRKLYEYASLDAIYLACREPLSRNGLTLSHDTCVIDGIDFLITRLIHVSGEEISNKVRMFIKSSAEANKELGSALTYARRYGICSLLGLPSEDDNDCEFEQPQSNKKPALQKNQPEVKNERAKLINEAQEKAINFLIGNNSTLLSRVLKEYKVSAIKDLSEDDAGIVLQRLQKSA